MTLETHLTEEYLSLVTEKAKASSKEDLYEAVKIYLENRIKNHGMDILNLEQDVSTSEEFGIYEKEIIEREMEEKEKLPYDKWTRSEYLVGFGNLLVRAGIIESHPYDITLVN